MIATSRAPEDRDKKTEAIPAAVVVADGPGGANAGFRRWRPGVSCRRMFERNRAPKAR